MSEVGEILNPGMKVQFVLEPGATAPEYSEDLASGMDVFALKDIDLRPFSVTRVETGVRLAWIEPGYEIQVRSRSGNTLKKNYFVANQPGTVDASYRGFCDVLLFYVPDFVEFEVMTAYPVTGESIPGVIATPDMKPFKIKAGDKIAQFVVCPVVRPEIEIVKEITSVTSRMGTGFGDSGDRSIKENK